MAAASRNNYQKSRIRSEKHNRQYSISARREIKSSMIITTTTNTMITQKSRATLYLLVIFVAFNQAIVDLANAQVAPTQPSGNEQQRALSLPDLTSLTSNEPIVAVIGQDAFISCVAKNLQNYTIIWRFSNEANAAGGDKLDDSTEATQNSAQSRDDPAGAILTAGRQRVTSDDRISVIQSHETWLLKINNVRPSDTGTYICHTNSEPRVRVPRILSVIKPSQSQAEASGKWANTLSRRQENTLLYLSYIKTKLYLTNDDTNRIHIIHEQQTILIRQRLKTGPLQCHRV